MCTGEDRAKKPRREAQRIEWGQGWEPIRKGQWVCLGTAREVSQRCADTMRASLPLGDSTVIAAVARRVRRV